MLFVFCCCCCISPAIFPTNSHRPSFEQLFVVLKYYKLLLFTFLHKYYRMEQKKELIKVENNCIAMVCVYSSSSTLFFLSFFYKKKMQIKSILNVNWPLYNILFDISQIWLQIAIYAKLVDFFLVQPQIKCIMNGIHFIFQ